MECEVLIVGAGPAGLAAAQRLLDRGIQPDIIDGANQIGSSWRRRHDQLHLNTHRRYSGQPGHPIPRKLGAFLSRNDYVTYLETVVAQLPARIQFGITATRINRTDNGRWQVETNEGPVVADQLIISTGSDRVAYTPHWPGMETYRGRLIHAADFGNALAYQGKKVLIVGAGNSGIDIANHLSRVEFTQAWLSVRNGPNIAPQYLLGLPTHPILMWSKWLPIPVQDVAVTLLSRLVLGDLTRFGLPAAPKAPVTRDMEDGITVAIDNGFAKGLKNGRFTILPEIAAFEQEKVHFKDGQSVEPDVVICATGYRSGLEPLVGHLDVLDETGKPIFMAEQSSPDHPGLWFLGLNSSIYGNMYIRQKESSNLADAIVALRQTSPDTPAAVIP